jgi:hypothetical protein
VIGANGFTPILKEFLDVDLNWESLKLLSAKVETPTAVVAATDRIRVVIIIEARQALTLLD